MTVLSSVVNGHPVSSLAGDLLRCLLQNIQLSVGQAETNRKLWAEMVLGLSLPWCDLRPAGDDAMGSKLRQNRGHSPAQPGSTSCDEGHFVAEASCREHDTFGWREEPRMRSRTGPQTCRAVDPWLRHNRHKVLVQEPTEPVQNNPSQSNRLIMFLQQTFNVTWSKFLFCQSIREFEASGILREKDQYR